MIRDKTRLLSTERLTLHPFTEEDKESVVSLLLNPDIYRTYMIPELEDAEEAADFFHRLKEFSERPDFFMYGIYLKEKLIGWINECGNKDGIEMGYVIDSAHRGHGYAPEALMAAAKELFALGEKRIVAGYFEGNNASRRVMEKCGFRPTDLVQEDEYRGEIRKCYYMSLENDS